VSPIIVQSPTRVDLAGGTLDLWPLYNFIGHACTVNVAIDVYTKATLAPRTDQIIVLNSKDLEFQREFSDLGALLLDSDPRLQLFKPILRYWSPSLGFSLTTESQSPVGGGLGGSSSLMVTLMKAFSQWMNRSFSSIHQFVHVCHNLEAEVLNTPTGTQDYYPAMSGGLNILTYTTDGVVQKVLPVSRAPFADSFLLVYTGKAHHSGINNFEVVKSAVARDPKTMDALRELRDISEQMAQVCESFDWNRLPALFNREFNSRVKLAPGFSSPEIKKLQEVAMQGGAQAVKICGAGGGGCVLVWTKSTQRQALFNLFKKAGFQPMNTVPVDPLPMDPLAPDPLRVDPS
jgi:D-glycero-alpha-D-manno-heptose-7-phosphate kinase